MSIELMRFAISELNKRCRDITKKQAAGAHIDDSVDSGAETRGRKVQ